MSNPRGYWIDRGNYVGTTDDRADRWYINRYREPIDHRGQGFATRAEALRHLTELLSSGEGGLTHANI